MNLFGLTGYPLGHSFSKEYFNNKFETEGREDCYFDLFPLERIDMLPGLLQSQPSLKGLAVTIPYKESVMPYLQNISDEAKAIGAVNCIEFLPSGLKGHNTDIIGFAQSFTPLLQPNHSKALVLGTGGASKAVQYVLKTSGIPFLLVSRTPDQGNISYTDISQALLNEYHIIINSTPLGMSPNEGAAPLLPYHFIGSNHYLYDLVYKPAETKFLQEGKSRGAVIKNGYEMLLLQAEENWKIWNAS